MSVIERNLKLVAYTYGTALGLIVASVLSMFSPKIGPLVAIFLGVVVSGLAYSMDRSLHMERDP